MSFSLLEKAYHYFIPLLIPSENERRYFRKPESRSRSEPLARNNSDSTEDTEHSITTAISSYDSPSYRLKISASLCFGGNALMALRTRSASRLCDAISSAEGVNDDGASGTSSDKNEPINRTLRRQSDASSLLH